MIKIPKSYKKQRSHRPRPPELKQKVVNGQIVKVTTYRRCFVDLPLEYQDNQDRVKKAVMAVINRYEYEYEHVIDIKDNVVSLDIQKVELPYVIQIG